MKSLCIVSVYFAWVIKNSAFVSIFGANFITSQCKLYYYQVACVNTSSFNGGWGVFSCNSLFFQIQERLFVALLLKRGLVFFFGIFVKDIGKTTNFPSLDYEEYSSPPQGRVQNFALEERGGGGV